MRPLVTRPLTALAISAALTLGAAGPAFADEHRPSRAADRAAHAPLPDAAALLTRTKALADVGGVTTPVTELLTAALKADEGQLPAADAEALKAKIQAAVDQAKETAPAPLPETPATPEPPVTPPVVDTPVAPPVVEAPVAPPAAEAPAGLPVKPPVTLPVAAGAKAAPAAQAAPADLVDDALGTVEKAVAGLVAAVTSGDAGGVVPQVTATLTSLVNLVVATVLGSGLPAPDLAGLPALPSLPVDPPVELPVDPPELPVDPPVDAPELPVDAPVKPPLPVR
ncbi:MULTISPECIES: hypothetical protein [unclassified Streptomyces]|uniref:hypothetical protein n=1 Tax=unclassified Streptomyces TaxID=2593676 RepID=UPI0019D0AF97|nr:MULTISPECIES: hypothetical protein [unclassified Streptomyces]